EWGFSGFTVSDANSAHDLAKHNFARDRADAAVRALNAGLDMEMALEAHDSVFNTLPQALADGRIDAARLDDAVRRVLTIKARLGLFDAPFAKPGAAMQVLDYPAHREAARHAAERSFVLLRNQDGVLPLDPQALRKIAVIGPLADSARDTIGPWVFDHDNAETVTVLTGIRDRLQGATEVVHVTGVSIEQRLNPSFFDDIPGFDIAPLVSVDDDVGIAEAVAAARDSEVALLVLGEAQNMIGEAASRSSLDLPGRQQELLEAVIATGTPTVLLIMAARPLDLKGAQPDAILQIWYPGTQGGKAVANAVFGDAVPGGKLPFTWVRSIGQVPLHYARMVTHKPKEREMRYWNEDGTPLYPFGFGLSYTTFAYSDLVIGAETIGSDDDLPIAVTLTNTGPVTGDEVVQLYIHQRHGSAARPVRELKGFERVTLAPGESRIVQFTLGAGQRRYWSSAARGWVADATTFDVYIGGDSTTNLAGTFTVTPAP
ncbi:MAG: glycoside hydrolase family 3 C-terminal domain-containing protein, partial [Erythrobacter sp.]|uniref:glycoside hydrolase family 3 C-terminal domain-containing protein n=1 Tax=Erythrobacter sp. TaxID=1042 RepID=UPI0025D6CCC5